MWLVKRFGSTLAEESFQDSDYKKACRYARSLGHSGQSSEKYFSANAYVVGDSFNVMYCPRFLVSKHKHLKKV